jgi:hypothetical protein
MKVLGGLQEAAGDFLRCPGAKYIRNDKVDGLIHGGREFAFVDFQQFNLENWRIDEMECYRQFESPLSI